MKYNTVTEILAQNDIPVIAIDDNGVITYVNRSFGQAYGWDEKLVGQVITVIMPPHMRDAHNFGFSRFLISEQPRILNTPLMLPVCCKDDRIIEAEHYITGEKIDGTWRFAATIIPVNKEV